MKKLLISLAMAAAVVFTASPVYANTNPTTAPVQTQPPTAPVKEPTLNFCYDTQVVNLVKTIKAGVAMEKFDLTARCDLLLVVSQTSAATWPDNRRGQVEFDRAFIAGATPGHYTLNVNMPPSGCFFQLDLVIGRNHRSLDAGTVTGGTRDCRHQPTPTTTVPPTTVPPTTIPKAPTTTVKAAPAPQPPQISTAKVMLPAPAPKPAPELAKTGGPLAVMTLIGSLALIFGKKVTKRGHKLAAAGK